MVTLRTTDPPWRPVIEPHLDQLADQLRLELGPIRAHTLTIHLDGPTLHVHIVTGDRDHATVRSIVDANLQPLAEGCAGLQITVDITGGGRAPLQAVPALRPDNERGRHPGGMNLNGIEAPAAPSTVSSTE